MAVISDNVVLAGQPFRQNVCLRAVAIRQTVIIARPNTGITLIGLKAETRLRSAPWRLCIKPNSGAA